MITKERLQNHPYIEADMVTASINFWFNTEQHIRSPFPDYVREELLDKSIMKYLDWADKLNDAAKKEINDDILVERFEEVLFETALDLVKTDDEKITVQYPFMLRVNDVVKETLNDTEIQSIVTERNIVKKGDDIFLHVKLKNMLTGECWERDFEVAG